MSPQRTKTAEANGTPQSSPTESPELLAQIFELAPDAKLLVNSEGRIIKANALAETMFGHARQDLVGQHIEVLIPKRFTSRHVEYRNGYLETPRTRPMGAGVELFAQRKDGSEFPVDIMLSPVGTEAGVLALAVVRDVTERKRAENEARQAREMYLKELHHRVKNNLQVISSLLFLQSTYTVDPATLEILKESQSRVKSIALIHEKLYRSPELTKIDFAEYVRDLVTDLFRTYGVNQGAVAVRMQVESMSLEIDTAIPCGLIINELVSNVLKHAFPAGRTGHVAIELSPVAPKEYVLTIHDDGVGLPKGYDWRTSTSLGLKLVVDLTRQLDGKLDVGVENGTTFRVKFKEVQYRERN